MMVRVRVLRVSKLEQKLTGEPSIGNLVAFTSERVDEILYCHRAKVFSSTVCFPHFAKWVEFRTFLLKEGQNKGLTVASTTGECTNVQPQTTKRAMKRTENLQTTTNHDKTWVAETRAALANMGSSLTNSEKTPTTTWLQSIAVEDAVTITYRIVDKYIPKLLGSYLLMLSQRDFFVSVKRAILSRWSTNAAGRADRDAKIEKAAFVSRVIGDRVSCFIDRSRNSQGGREVKLGGFLFHLSGTILNCPGLSMQKWDCNANPIIHRKFPESLARVGSMVVMLDSLLKTISGHGLWVFLSIFKKFLFWGGNGPGVASFDLKRHFFSRTKATTEMLYSSFSHNRLATKRGVLFEIRGLVDYWRIARVCKLREVCCLLPGKYAGKRKGPSKDLNRKCLSFQIDRWSYSKELPDTG